MSPRVLLLDTLEQIAIHLKEPNETKAKSNPSEAQQSTSAVNPVVRQKSSRPTEASLMQVPIWEYQRAHPTSAIYNLPAAFRLLGKLNPRCIRTQLSRVFTTA